jgi:tripartite-type tricarboxylate transporter receptor subunit TctC
MNVARRMVNFVVLAAAACLCLTDPGRAADWPTRQVTILVPTAAGGNTDLMARLAAEHLGQKLGQPFVVENRPSAGGALTSTQVSTAEPDGHTILFAPHSMVLLTPLVQKITFDPGKLMPVTNVGTGSQVVAVRRELPVKTLPEFLAHAKANPGKLNFAIAGANNISHLGPALLFKRAGVDLVMVPARGEPQAISDLMAGNADLYFGNASVLLQQREHEKIRILAVGRCRVSSSPPGTAFSFRPARPRR